MIDFRGIIERVFGRPLSSGESRALDEDLKEAGHTANVRMAYVPAERFEQDYRIVAVALEINRKL